MKSSRDSLPDRTERFAGPVFRATKAGAFYAIIVFVIGFILGTIRVLRLAPRLGETIAVIVEAPVILAASWFVCRWCVDRLDVRRTVSARSLMGLAAFLVLMSVEVAWVPCSVDRSWTRLTRTDTRLERLVWPHRWSSPRSRSFRSGGASASP